MKRRKHKAARGLYQKISPLKRKVFLFVVAICLSISSLLYMGLSNYLTHRFNAIEENIAWHNIQQIQETLETVSRQLVVKAADYSKWTETYQFVEDRNPQYLKDSLGDPELFLNTLACDLMLIVNQHGEIIHGSLLDPERRQIDERVTALGELILAHYGKMVTFQNHDESTQGIIITSQGPMMVAATPILDSNHNGPIRGAVIFGRYVDQKLIEELSQQTRFNLSYLSNDMADTPHYTGSNRPDIQAVDEQTFIAYTPLTDIEGRHFGWIKHTSARPIYQEARRSVAFLFAACTAIGLLMSLLVVILVNNLIVSRITQVVRWIDNISHCGELSLRTEIAGDDELGDLVDAINHMFAVFEKSEKERQTSEAEFRESQRTLTTLMSNLPGMAFRRKHDEDWSLLFASEGALELTGYPPQMLTQDQAKYGHLINEEDHQRTLNEINEAVRQNTPYRVAYRIKTKDASEKWVWEQGSSVTDNDDNLIAIEGFITDITDSQTAQHELMDLAKHDQLTGLPNRSQIKDRINQAIERGQSDFNHQFALIYIDFDRFKVINDSMGHGDGDKLLQQIAERIIKGINQALPDAEQPPEDSVFRLGGDEFAIMLEPMRLSSDAEKVATFIREQITQPFHLNGRAIHITASMGIVTSDIGHDTAEDMIRDADTAMYHAKSNGRDRHAVFNKTMYFQALERMEIEHELRKAIDENEFYLAYQPVLNLESASLCGFEALIRWQHPGRGVVPPVQFIPLAEETGLIVPIGEFVLETACRQLVEWQPKYGQDRPLKMGVNLSRRQLVEPGLIDTVKEIMSRTGIDPTWLDLEITENSIMEDIDKVLPILDGLRELGIKLSMDDFGTGHSSMSHLHKFPIDILKIDRAFVANMNLNPEYAAITQAIIDLAHNLNMNVIAEGIEEPGQLAQLQALECDMAQGYFFSKPLPKDEIEPWIEAEDYRAAG